MRDKKKLKFITYAAASLYIVIFILYGVIKYDFTLNRPTSPDAAGGRTEEVEGFYTKHVYVTKAEQIAFYSLDLGMQIGFVAVFALGALYWRNRR